MPVDLSIQGFQFEKKVPGGVIRVAGAKLQGEGCGRGIPLLERRESFKIYIPGDAFLCIFSDKKCFFGRHHTLEKNEQRYLHP